MTSLDECSVSWHIVSTAIKHTTLLSVHHELYTNSPILFHKGISQAASTCLLVTLLYRCSPVQFMGPKRVVPPAFEVEDPKMPKLDFVLLSHNHYDHLDAGSVKRLHKRYGKDLIW